MMISDLRWLVAKGLAEHGQETSIYGDSHRSFRPSDGLNFAPTTYLFLTPKGATFAGNVLQASAASRPSILSIDSACMEKGEPATLPSDCPAADEMYGPPAVPRPRWDPTRRELWLDDMIVKRFQVPARNQQAILCEFEEEDWPEHIDDPLPVSGDIDPRTRLHDAIYRLNHHQTNGLLRFHGNGNADGVLWELL